MWSEEFDRKLKDAAGKHDPAYNDRHWDSMQSMLDVHLPVRKKRRPLLFWLLPLLTGTGLVIFLLTGRQQNQSIAEKQKEQAAPTTGKTILPTAEGQRPAAEDKKEAAVDKPGTTPDEARLASVPAQLLTLPNTGHPVKKKNGQPAGKAVYDEQRTTARQTLPAVEPRFNSPAETNHTTLQPASETTPPTLPAADPSAVSANGTTAVLSTVPDSSNNPPKPAVPAKKRNGNQLAINFSAGPDLSSIGMNKPGQWAMQYGIGLSYPLTKRLALRTGFFVGRKVYDADSADYNPPPNFWNYYNNMQKIEANCLVYEIPVNLVYHFPAAGKHNWFVSTGFSSYLMKKETYEYYFKDSYGQPDYRERTISNENHHFFSVLSVSGGYQYLFNDRLSLMAEPYFKIPLDGVGFGNVKLNSTGILLTLSYKPFVKSTR